MCIKHLLLMSHERFPSLTGVIRFLIDTVNKQTIQNKCQVSVPYRGYSFFNLILTECIIVLMLFGFPSLTGVIRFLIHLISDSKVLTACSVSVPYRGYSFFNFRKFKNLNVNIKVSVPYRGYSFFN